MNGGGGGGTSNISMPECWNNMRNGIRLLADKNIFFSSEVLNFSITPRGWWLALADMIQNEFGYRMIIIVGYRRLIDWIPSALGQARKLTNTRDRRWTRDGGRVLKPMYPSLLQSEYINQNNNYTSMMMFDWTPTYLNVIPTDIIETRLFNQHAKTNHSLITNFFCDVIPEATATCHDCLDIESRQETDNVYNPAIPYWFHEMVIEAEMAGMINTEAHKRLDVYEAAIEYNHKVLKRNNNDIDHLQ